MLEQGRFSPRAVVLQLWVTLLELQSSDSAAGLSLRAVTEWAWPVGSPALQSSAVAVEGWVR